MSEMMPYIRQVKDRVPNRYYVYLHRRLSDNSVFYVGKGSGSRAWSANSRNRYWSNTVLKHGFSVDIVFDNLSEEDSLDCEINTIKEFEYFGYRLVNMTSGGETCKHTVESRRLMSEQRKGKPKSAEHNHKVSLTKRGKPRPDLVLRNLDNNLYSFINTVNDDLFIGTRTDFIQYSGVKRKLLQGLFSPSRPRHVVCGWSLLKDENGKD